MIVTRRDRSFWMIDQHEHARLSAAMAAAFKPGLTDMPQLLTAAVRGHDRAWQILDREPLWNDHAEKPYSFLDFPADMKMVFYEQGLQQTESENPGCALLQSLHYCSLVKGRTSGEKRFLKREQVRQARLADFVPEADLDGLLKLLQFTDSLSLYVCMRPGVAGIYRQEENGFHASEDLPFTNGLSFQAEWTDGELTCSPSPFHKQIDFQLEARQLQLDDCKDNGLVNTFRHTRPTALHVKIR
ncbi:DUF3891 family protein [Alkalicoccus luteus]|uniref:DUF3891 family protein n=1 Tax=Alkalicoccus luteus TaxID=1237094 RepID=A0A969TTM0_9BACI|nr:DUF3891 family protein [Alkalicoccus luteus]NJP36415.1 DUF3891 family protein [Alkalicoccus luteus]